MIICAICNTPHEPNHHSPCCSRGCKQAWERRNAPRKPSKVAVNLAKRNELRSEIIALHAQLRQKEIALQSKQLEVDRLRLRLRMHNIQP